MRYQKEGAICPYCEEKVSIDDLEIDVRYMGREAPKSLSQYSEEPIQLGMVYCPECGKILSFIYG